MVTKQKKKSADTSGGSQASANRDVVEKNELGLIKIHEGVIGDVVFKAASKLKEIELDGVSFVDNIASMLGSRNKSGIIIEMKDDSVKVEVRVNIKYGENIPEVAAKVQTAIKDEVMNITGMKVDQVDIIVQSLIEEKPVKEAPPKKAPAAKKPEKAEKK